MTELNVKIDMATLPNLINTEIENFRHYQVNMGKNVLDVFQHTISNNLFYIGPQFAKALEYKDSKQALENNVFGLDQLHISYAPANILISLEINELANRGMETSLKQIQEIDSNLLINKENNLYKLSKNGVSFIAEEGAMDLLMDSHKPEAKAFRRKLIDIAVTIRQTGSYGITKPSNMDLSELSRCLDSMEKFMENQTTFMERQTNNGTIQNKTTEKLIELIDNRNKLTEKIENVMHRTLGSAEYWQKNTICINNTTATASKYWNKFTTVWEALCNIVTYTKSLASQLAAHNKLIKELTKNNLDIRKSLRNTNTDVLKNTTGVNTLQNQYDDQLVANIVLIKEELEELKSKI